MPSQAWLGLIAKHYTAYYDLARECYEVRRCSLALMRPHSPHPSALADVLVLCYVQAFVIHALFQFLLHYLGGHEKIVVDSKDHHVHKHMIPCCCLKDWSVGGAHAGVEICDSLAVLAGRTTTVSSCRGPLWARCSTFQSSWPPPLSPSSSRKSVSAAKSVLPQRVVARACGCWSLLTLKRACALRQASTTMESSSSTTAILTL